QPFPQPEQPFP
nr:Chain C, DQ2-glia-omega1 peptide [Homo sapiens]